MKTLPLILLSAFCLWADDAEELRQAAHSPYDLQHFIQSHADFDRNVLAKELGIEISILCEPLSACSPESFRIGTTRPEDLVLRINDHRDGALFLRYREIGRFQNQWTFRGHYEPNVKYFKPEHRVITVEGKSFLTISEQGGSGTGLSVAWVSVFDPRLPGFTKVLSFIDNGHWSGSAVRPGREVHGFLASLQTRPRDAIRIHYTASFFADPGVELGHLQADAVYTRIGSGEFHFDAKASSAAADEILSVYKQIDGEDDNPKNYDRDFLHYNFANLRQIAAGPRSAAKKWLTQYLTRCPNTQEKQQLQQLLTAR
jgi:hypothetical protein